MICPVCPVDLASDLSAFRAAGVGDHRRHGLLLTGRGGASNESTGSNFARHGEEDYLVAGGGDYWSSASEGGALAPTSPIPLRVRSGALSVRCSPSLAPRNQSQRGVG